VVLLLLGFADEASITPPVMVPAAITAVMVAATSFVRGMPVGRRRRAKGCHFSPSGV
jgi:hypothetical protein